MKTTEKPVRFLIMKMIMINFLGIAILGLV